MRDWQSGPQWDRRTLYELTEAGSLIHVTCGYCRHQSDLKPRHLLTLQPWYHWWGALGYRLKCSICGRKRASIRLIDPPRLEPTPKPRPPVQRPKLRLVHGNGGDRTPETATVQPG